MNDVIMSGALPPSSPEVIDIVKKVEARAEEEVQVDIETNHVLHDGVYTRTICVPAGVMITGALIKIPTTLTISGQCLVLIGDGEGVEIKGFAVMPTSAGRKQVFIARSDTHISMCFKTDAKTVEQAEVEFTDESNMLKSKVNKNNITITEG